MACQSSAANELIDMIECCSICTEVFTDPRVLPCIHTFCLKCLLNYGKDKRPGDSMPCPLCRKEFTIPDDGLSGTQKNFFVEKQIHEKQLSALEEVFQKVVSRDKLKVAIRWKTTNDAVDIHVDSNYSRPPKVIHVITMGVGIGGLTSLGDHVFVIPYPYNHWGIEVYDAETFTLQRRIPVPYLSNYYSYTYALAACPHNNCLYASEYHKDSVHRVELSGSNAVKWSVARRPVGLSVNSEHNLLVVGEDPSMLQIFTTHGTLLQSIQLQYIGRPHYAVQLPTGQFLVSACGSLQRFCLVGVDGEEVRSYRGHGRQYRGISPGGIAVDREGRVLVADRLNNRLLVMDQSLSSAHEMSVRVDGGLKDPRSLWYDQSRRRLYIGESKWAGGRVIVIDNLKDFSAAQVNA